LLVPHKNRHKGAPAHIRTHGYEGHNPWHTVYVYIKCLDELNLVKLSCGGLVLGSSQFWLLPQVALKNNTQLKVVKIDSKIIIWL
jgi:hypothetical protein